MTKQEKQETPAEKFECLLKKVVSAPKAEIDRREKEWKEKKEKKENEGKP